MKNYIISFRPGFKTESGKDLTLDRVLGKVEGIGGKVLDEAVSGMSALIGYEGTKKELEGKRSLLLPQV